ncbi:MAG TPA: hypothetical protein VFN67_33250 [Polyangiales bacterium]|nr:hypothetical protein [Polyangiales bacterium]
MQTLTVLSWTFAFNAEIDAYGQVALADLDCNEWQCLMDPSSKACVNTQ